MNLTIFIHIDLGFSEYGGGGSVKKSGLFFIIGNQPIDQMEIGFYLNNRAYEREGYFVTFHKIKKHKSTKI